MKPRRWIGRRLSVVLSPLSAAIMRRTVRRWTRAKRSYSPESLLATILDRVNMIPHDWPATRIT